MHGTHQGLVAQKCFRTFREHSSGKNRESSAQDRPNKCPWDRESKWLRLFQQICPAGRSHKLKNPRKIVPDRRHKESRHSNPLRCSDLADKVHSPLHPVGRLGSLSGQRGKANILPDLDRYNFPQDTRRKSRSQLYLALYPLGTSCMPHRRYLGGSDRCRSAPVDTRILGHLPGSMH
jgi:hypothetical protein